MDKVGFHYTRQLPKWLQYLPGAGIVAAFILMTQVLVPGLVLLVAMALLVNLAGVCARRGLHAAGAIEFGPDAAVLRTGGSERVIVYGSVRKVVREWYERETSMAGVAYTQPSPGQYTIHLADGQALVLRVSGKEQAERARTARQLSKEIYGMSTLGVSLVSGKPVDEIEEQRRDAEFAARMPTGPHSLETAMEKLLERCGIALTDKTGV